MEFAGLDTALCRVASDTRVRVQGGCRSHEAALPQVGLGWAWPVPARNGGVPALAFPHRTRSWRRPSVLGPVRNKREARVIETCTTMLYTSSVDGVSGCLIVRSRLLCACAKFTAQPGRLRSAAGAPSVLPLASAALRALLSTAERQVR